MNEVRLIAPFHNVSGYAKAGRVLLSAFLRLGWRVQAVEQERQRVVSVGVNGVGRETFHAVYRDNVEQMPSFQRVELEEALQTPVSPSAPTFIMGNPNGLTGCQQFSQTEAFRVGLTMWEVEDLPLMWQNGAKSPDQLLLPSLWNLEGAKKAGVGAEYFPLGVDERVYTLAGDKYPLQNRPKFAFLSVFSVCERKNWRVMVQAFAEEFRGEDVALYLKCGREGRDSVKQLAEWCRQMEARVEVLDATLTDAEMASLYRAVDCYVLPSTEGFGLPYIEAAICGVPSIGLAENGSSEVLTMLESAQVKACRVPSVGQLPQVYRAENFWYAPDMESLKSEMRRAVSGDFSLYSADLAEMAVANYGIDAQARALRGVMENTQKRTYRPHAVADTYSIATVITTHNNLEMTRRCVETLEEARWFRGTIVLADDDSTDGTHEWAREQGIEVVTSGIAGNVSANRKAATEWLYRQGHTGYILYLDNDIESRSDWVTPLVRTLQQNPDVGIIAPLKRFGDGTIQNLGNRYFASGGTRPMKYVRDWLEVDYVESAAMLVAPEVLESGVSWSEEFPIFYEDADFCMQAQAQGFKVVACGISEVTHHAHTTSASRAEESELNRVKFLKKWRYRL